MATSLVGEHCSFPVTQEIPALVRNIYFCFIYQPNTTITGPFLPLQDETEAVFTLCPAPL